MSFTIDYRPLFHVTIQDHQQALASPADPPFLTGITLQPASVTRKLFEDHHLIFRPQEGGFAVYFSSNPQSPQPLLGQISDRIRLSFFILLKQANFFNLYVPELTSESGPQLYFDNLTATGNLQVKESLTSSTFVKVEDAVKIFPHIFYIAVQKGAGDGSNVLVRDKFNPANIQLTIPIPNPAVGVLTFIKIDMADFPSGPYTVKTDAAGAVPRNIYIDNDAAKVQPLGILDIYWETAQDLVPSKGVSYAIRFKKK